MLLVVLSVSKRVVKATVYARVAKLINIPSFIYQGTNAFDFLRTK